MSSRKNLINALRRANRLNQSLRIRNTELKKEIDLLKFRIRIQKGFCSVVHRQKLTFWLTNWYWRAIYYLENRNQNGEVSKI